jgi:hypothetical protein
MSRAVELVLAIVGVVTSIGMLACVPWLVRRLPEDYFVVPPRPHSLARRLGQNLLALALIGLGVALLVLPGQGVLTILIGLSLLDLPIKRRALSWLLHRPKIEQGVQRLRARGGQPPLVIPAA